MQKMLMFLLSILKSKPLYKFLRTDLKSDYDQSQWKIGIWRKTKCTELCAGFNCSEKIIDAFNYVKGEVLAQVKTRGKHFVDTNKQTWEEMCIVKVWDWTKTDNVRLSIFAAEQLLAVFEKKYPTDKMPRQAIDTAKEWLKNPTTNANYALANANYAAYAASTSVYAVADADSIKEECENFIKKLLEEKEAKNEN